MHSPKRMLDVFQYQVDSFCNQLKDLNDLLIKDNKVYLSDYSLIEGFSFSSDAVTGEEYEIYVNQEFTGHLIIENDIYYSHCGIRRDVIFRPDAPVEYITCTFNI